MIAESVVVPVMLLRAYEVPVRIPVELVMEPPVSVTVPTVSEFAPRISEPPVTVTAPVSARVFVA